jgi:type II secretory pathway component PulF
MGIAVLWSLRMILGSRHLVAGGSLFVVLNIAAWILMLFGIVMLATPIALIPVLVIWGMVVSQYRNSERRQLLWLISIAARSGLPIVEATQAFAQDRNDEVGDRAWRLSQLLNDGVALPLALRESRNLLPVDAQTAIELGYATNRLSSSVDQAMNFGDRISALRYNMIERLAYPFFALLLATAVTILFTQRIAPTIGVILEDFEIADSEPASQWLHWTNVVERSSWMLIPLNGVVWFIVVYAAIRYLGFRVPEFPLAGRIFGRIEVPIVSRAISQGVQSGRPISEAIDVLAQIYPQRDVGRKLANVAYDIEKGSNWCEGLRRQGLLRNADVALLQSAERVGNLAWALREVSEMSLRRMEHRGAIGARLFAPVFVIMLGVVVGLAAYALFSVFHQLITTLAK